MNMPDTAGARQPSYLDQYLPTEPPVYRITDIDFDRWAHEGVKALLVDVEGCLGETGSPDLVPEYVGALEEARGFGIEHIALHTNKVIRSQEDRALLRSWSEQSGADLVLTPLKPEERKPSQIMSRKAMQKLGLTPADFGVVDDKASAGIRAGSFAGIEHRALTRSFGGNRHPGDRIVRDPFEAVVRLRAHLLLTPTAREELELSAEQMLQIQNGTATNITELFPANGSDGLDNIIGLGVADEQLPPEVLALIKQPRYRRAIKEIRDVLDYYGEQPAEKLKEFLKEHGRTTADWLTYSRLGIAAGLIALNRSDLDPETKRKIAAGLVTIGNATDGADGYAARGHKDGATKEGGGKDQKIDHVLQAVIDIFTLLPMESITQLDAAIPIARDLGLTAIRRPFSQRGFDTKSILSGKIATGALGGSQLFDLILGNRYPRLGRNLRKASAVAKGLSMVQAPFVWVERHEEKQHKHKNLARLGGIALPEALEA